MKPGFIPVLAAFILAAMMVCHLQTAAAQEATSDRSSDDTAEVKSIVTVPVISSEEVAAALAAIEADANLSEEQKAALRTTYQKVTDALTQAEQFAAQTKSFTTALETAPRNEAENRKELSELRSAETPAKIDIAKNSSELRKIVNAQQATLQGLKDVLAQVSEKLLEIEGRPLEIGKRLPEVQRDYSLVRNKWDEMESINGDLSPTQQVDRYLVQADAMRLSNEASMMEQENLSQSVRQEELESRRDLLRRQVELAQATFDALSKRMEQKLSTEVERIKAFARDASADLPRDEQVQDLAADVRQLAMDFESMVANVRSVAPATLEVTRRYQQLNIEYRDVRNELSLGSGGGALAQVLLELARRAQPNALEEQVSITVEQSRLEWFQIRKKRRKQAEIKSQFEEYQSEAVQQLVSARSEILSKYQDESANLTQSLVQLRIETLQYSDLCEEIQGFVAESMFGFHIRSCPPVGFGTLTGLPGSLAWLFSRDHLTELANAIRIQSAMVVAFVLIVIILFLMRPRLITGLDATAAPTRRISTDRYVWTAKALVRTLLLSAPIPILVGLAALVLSQAPDQSEWMTALARGCQRVFGITLVSCFIVQACRPGGLGIVHFKWDSDIAASLAATIKSIVWVYVPLMLLTISLGFGEAIQFHYLDSVGRLSFIVAHVWVIFVLWRLLKSNGDQSEDRSNESRSSVLRFWHAIWPPLLIGTPFFLVVIDSIGYLLTAVELSLGLCTSACLIAVGQVAYDMSIRWFRIRGRRMALAEAIAQRKTRMAAKAMEGPEGEAAEMLHLNEEEEVGLDLAVAGGQTVAILRLIVNFAIMVVLYNFWSSAIPLTSALDRIPVPMAGGLSLLTLVTSMIVVVVAGIIVRNLPGLLEFSVLRNSDIEAGTRNAIYTLCQYAVIGMTLIALSNILELDWAKLGWMAAALSVGIGFGLQEVVGNFVCGLIVLFERPIRVGDVVTMEGTTGTVTNINMRATTITNWDRQELVVPNKNLISGTFMNWTLNESINRLVILVGVAYGTDTE